MTIQITSQDHLYQVPYEILYFLYSVILNQTHTEIKISDDALCGFPVVVKQLRFTHFGSPCGKSPDDTHWIIELPNTKDISCVKQGY